MKTRACKNFKACDDDPVFCANCAEPASYHKGPTPGAPRQFRLSVPVKPAAVDELTKELAERFLRWPLPDSVRADLCATKQGPGRIGTNLLSYIEARQMMQDVVLTTLREKGIQL